VRKEPQQPVMAHAVEERPCVGIDDPVHLPAVNPGRQRIQRIVLAAPRPEAVGEAEESVSQMAFSTSPTARWTILFSSAAIPRGPRAGRPVCGCTAAARASLGNNACVPAAASTPNRASEAGGHHVAHGLQEMPTSA
jgi:hypothetical protein